MQLIQPTFKFNLRDQVTISSSNETGEVRARSDNTSGESQYRVAYRNAQGVATEAWWCEDQLTSAT